MKRHVRVSKETTLTMRREDVVQAIQRVFPEVPDGAQITVVVPSGGDYSGDSLDLEECGGLTVYWQDSEGREEEI
jgi:hypothetical protein